MASDLSPETESFIQHEIAIGAFRDRNDAIEAGIAMLRRRNDLVARLRESRRQLDEGDYVEFDDDGLRGFFADLTSRASGSAETK